MNLLHMIINPFATGDAYMRIFTVYNDTLVAKELKCHFKKFQTIIFSWSHISKLKR